LLFLQFPPLVGHAVEYAPLASLSREALLWRALVWMPLDTAIPEEVAFRGVLLASLRRRWSELPAVLVSAAVFASWHGVIVSRTVALTNLQSEPVLAMLGLFGAFLAVCVGGVLFAWLRLATGHLAGSIIAHWAFNTVLLLGLGSGGKGGRDERHVLTPAGTQTASQDPEQLVRGVEAGTRSGSSRTGQHCEFMTQEEVLEHEVVTRARRCPQAGEQQPEQFEHAPASLIYAPAEICRPTTR
jgi:hypothetical protein